MQVDRDKISLLIARIRKSHNYSQEQMADFLGVSARTIRNWEKGFTMPSMEDVAHITTAFDLSLESFYQGVLKENHPPEYSEQVNREDKENEETAVAKDQLLEFRELVLKYDEGGNRRKLRLLLFIIHFITVITNYRLFFEGPPAYLLSFLVSAFYMISIIVLILRNYRNDSFQITLITYFSVLFANTVLLSSLYDSSFGIAGYVEFFAFNGSFYGLMIFKTLDFLALLSRERVVYCIIVICLVILYSKNNPCYKRK